MTTKSAVFRYSHLLLAWLLIQEEFALKTEGDDAPRRCTNYRSLNHGYRNVNKGPIRKPKCDKDLVPFAWYRFGGGAGNMMPSSHVRGGQCSAACPGWVQGNHPLGHYETNHALVCFDTHTNKTCGENVSIEITNCGGYYVYRLPSVGALECKSCARIYCGDFGAMPSSGPSLRTSTNPRQSSSPVPIYFETTSSNKRTTGSHGYCPEEQRAGIKWPPTEEGKSTSQPCPDGEGFVKRTCSSHGWEDENINKCRPLEIKELYEVVEHLNNQNLPQEILRKTAENVVNNLGNITGRVKRLTKYELVCAVEILHGIIKLNISNAGLNVLLPASNTLDIRNKKTWDNLENSSKVISNLVVTLEDYGFQVGRDMETNKNRSNLRQNSPNLELHVKLFEPDSHSTVQYMPFHLPNSSCNLSSDVFQNSVNRTTVVVIVHYKTLNSVLKHVHLAQQVNDVEKTDKFEINGAIITASVNPKPPQEFRKPVRITWNTKKLTGKTSRCVFWKPESNSDRWSTKGCRMVEQSENDDQLTCECNHLTAFAVMDISHDMLTEHERQSLELISTIGCSLSLLGIFLTMTCYGVLWKRLNSSTKTEVRPRVLMHLCVAVGMTDILAIVAGPAQNTETFCLMVSILLYFFVLSIFGWMLCEGIIIYLQLVRVFTGLGGRHLRVFYLIGWAIPMIVTVLSVTLIDREVFITEHACWFKASGSLLWTFIGTAGTILLINSTIFILVLKNMFSSHNLRQTGLLNKVKAGVKATAVLLPLLGLTWLFSFLVINRDTLVFKYLFAIFNSLQGLMIFIFHVVINKQIHDVMHRKRALSQNLSKFPTNPVPNNRKCGTLSTSVNNYRMSAGETGSLPLSLKSSLNRSKTAQYSMPLVISNDVDNNGNNIRNETKNSLENYNSRKRSTELTLEDLEHSR